MRKLIAIVGDSCIQDGGEKYLTAFAAGKALVDNGYRVQTGGLYGVMRAAFAGAKSSEKRSECDTVAILPSHDISQANEFADIVIPTGLDVYRNGIVASASAVVVVGGGAGTLSEVAFAWSLYKMIVAFDNVDGWSKKLAGQRVDERVRYEGFDDRVFGVSDAGQMIDVLNRMLPLYTKFHDRILDKKINLIEK